MDRAMATSGFGAFGARALRGLPATPTHMCLDPDLRRGDGGVWARGIMLSNVIPAQAGIQTRPRRSTSPASARHSEQSAPASAIGGGA
jgi:hypothetical protein